MLLDLAGRPAGTDVTANHENSLPSLACACLLSLVIARGDTDKLLEATTSSLMCASSLSAQPVKVKNIVDIQE